MINRERIDAYNATDPHVECQITDQETWSCAVTQEGELLCVRTGIDYTEPGTSTRSIKGYGVRLSAPDYLDCTEWVVFDTLDEAEEYAVDNLLPEEPKDK